MPPQVFSIRTGPFTAQVRTRIPAVAEGIRLLYDERCVGGPVDFADFHLSIDRSRGLRRWFRPQAQFRFDGVAPFTPLPLAHAFPALEWGLNWCTATHSNGYLVVHAAVIERNGRAVIMPGVPGAGKSTLTAGLVNRGWRLLSDELALISLVDGRLTALARPISLKNASIAVIRRFVPGAVLGPECRDTVKGVVAHLRPPAESLARIEETAHPAWIIAPRYVNGLPAELVRRSKAATLIEIARNSYNYSIHGARGFTALADLVEACDCYHFSYADLNEAVATFDTLEPPRGGGA